MYYLWHIESATQAGLGDRILPRIAIHRSRAEGEIKTYHVRIIPFGKPILSCTIEAISMKTAIDLAWVKLKACEYNKDYITITAEESHDAEAEERYLSNRPYALP